MSQAANILKEKIRRDADKGLAESCLLWLFAVFLPMCCLMFCSWVTSLGSSTCKADAYLWITTGVISRIDVDLFRPVKAEKLLGMSKNTLIAAGTLMLEAVMATDADVPSGFMKAVV